MSDKLKGIIAGAKDLLLYIVLPLATLAGYIAYLIAGKRALQDENTVLKSEKDNKEKVDAANNQEKISDSAVADFEHADDLYRKSRESNLRSGTGQVSDSGAGAKEDDRTKGSGDK